MNCSYYSDDDGKTWHPHPAKRDRTLGYIGGAIVAVCVLAMLVLLRWGA